MHGNSHKPACTCYAMLQAMFLEVLLQLKLACKALVKYARDAHSKASVHNGGDMPNSAQQAHPRRVC